MPLSLLCLSAACSKFNQQCDGFVDSGTCNTAYSAELTDVLRHSIVSHEEHLNYANTEMQKYESCITNKGWEIEGTTPQDAASGQ